MSKRTIFILFLFCAASQIFLSVSSVVFNERILSAGELHRFKTRPIDPYDPFRGKYVQLEIDQSVALSDSEGVDFGEKIYVILERGADGYSNFSKISDSKPAAEDYIKLEIDYIGGDRIYFDIPFDRYYIDEDYAEDAESAYARADQEISAYIEVKVKYGRAVLEELFIEDLPVIEYLKL